MQPSQSPQKIRFAISGQTMEGVSPDADRDESAYQWTSAQPWDSYLYKGESETAAEYKERCSRAYHIPHFAPCVSEIVSGIFRSDPERPDSGEPWSTYWRDIDDAGTDIDPYMRYLTSLAFACGRVHNLTDRTAADGEPRTLAEQMASGVRSYCQSVSAIDLINWSIDAAGRFRWVVIREPKPDYRDPGEDFDDQDDPYQYRVWTADGFMLFRDGKDENPSETGVHNMGRVPLRSLFLQRTSSPRAMACESPFASQVDLDRHLYNDLSEMWVADRGQSFALLAIPQEEGRAGAPIDIGPARAFGYPAHVGAPVFVAPPGGLLGERWQRHKDKRREGRMSEGLGRGVAEQSIERRSADAIVEEMRTQLSQMSEWTAAVQEFDRQIHMDLARSDNRPEKSAPMASYTRSFYRTAVLAATNVVLQLRSTDALGKKATAMLVKPIVKSYLAEQGCSRADISEVLELVDIEAEREPEAPKPAPFIHNGSPDAD